MHTDFDLPTLETYRSRQVEPSDFLDFWSTSKLDADAHDLDVRVQRTATALAGIEVFDVAFRGAGGHDVRAWLRVPGDATTPLPTIVQFLGYGRGRGRPEENLLWANAGFAHLEMDSRGQGWHTMTADTTDPAVLSGSPPGLAAVGISSKETYYYRRLIIDAYRAVSAAVTIDIIDSTRIFTMGISQGGALALAAAQLHPNVRSVVSRVPFLSDLPRAIRIGGVTPYTEISAYLALHRREQKSIETGTLPYFDLVNFARHSTAPLLMSVALMDAVCPPSTVYAAFNAYAGPKQLITWEFNGHEGGGIDDDIATINYFNER